MDAPQKKTPNILIFQMNVNFFSHPQEHVTLTMLIKKQT